MRSIVPAKSHSWGRQHTIVLAVLWFAVILSSLMVVYSSYITRLKVNELEVLRAEHDTLQVVWSQYLLEESAWASFGRVEKIAIEKLSMQIPLVDDIVMVTSDEG